MAIEPLEHRHLLSAVLSITPSVAVVTDNNFGIPQTEPSNAGFTFRINYSAPMDLSSTPTVTFTPDVTTTLTYHPSKSWWVSSTTYKAAFDVADAGVLVTSVGVGASGARDTGGNLQDAYAGTNNFAIDTLDPPPLLPTVANATPSVTEVTNLNIGSNMFALRIAVDFDVVDRVSAGAGCERDDAVRAAVERAEGLADAELAGGHECVAVLAPEGVVGRNSNRSIEAVDGQIENSARLVGERAGDDAAVG